MQGTHTITEQGTHNSTMNQRILVVEDEEALAFGIRIHSILFDKY